jgi:CheY-like chemotaxis protein
VILIIEDDPSMRDVLVAQFESLARAIGVQSAEAGLEVLTREPVGAIVLDPGLPGMSGLEFARAIRQDPKLRTLPLFLFSAREHATEELRAAGIRASDAFVKTRDSEALLFDRVRLELQKRR